MDIQNEGSRWQYPLKEWHRDTWNQTDIGTILTPSLPQPVTFPGWKVHTYTPANSIFDGPTTNLLSILCTLIEVLLRAHVKGGKNLNYFKFGTFIDCLPSDGMTSMAVKGLKATLGKCLWHSLKSIHWYMLFTLLLCHLELFTLLVYHLMHRRFQVLACNSELFQVLVYHLMHMYFKVFVRTSNL